MGWTRAFAMLGAWVLFALLFLAFLAGSLQDPVHRGVHEASGVRYAYAHDDDAPAGSKPFVWFRAEGKVERVRVLYREAGEDASGSVTLDRVGGGAVYAGELPALDLGESLAFHFVVETERGATPLREGEGITPEREFTVPAGAPGEARPFRVTFEGDASPAVLVLHVGLTALAPLFLLHALFSVFLALRGRFSEKGGLRAELRKAHLNALAATALFFVGAVPLGILANRARYGTLFEGWPFGNDATSTLTEVVLLAWVALLLWRADLLRARGAEKPVADRLFPLLFLLALALTVAAFALAHSPCSA
jgi:hypothetical protein